MSKTIFIRRIKRQVRRRPLISSVTALLLFIVAAAFIHQYMNKSINPLAYRPLLHTIAKGESRGNYNAYFGAPHNTKIDFTDMTIAEVLEWQHNFVRKGNPSNAVGKYQIIRPTLAGLVQELHINPQEYYDETMQDRLAIALLERRGAKQFVAKNISRQQFAANLAKEWAALPKAIGSNPERSHYAGDGLNRSQVSLAEVYAALALLEQHAH